MKKEDFSKEFIKTAKNWCTSFAPGRIEFLGNHLDYNGGNVLGMAVNAGIYCLGIPNSENKALGITEEKNQFSLFSESFEDASWTGMLENIERQKGKSSWTNYCFRGTKRASDKKLGPKRRVSPNFHD